MEKFAYDYVVNVKKYTSWTPYKHDNGTIIEKMPMTDVFDNFAGTSTGSILATALVIPKEKGKRQPKFWGSDTVNIYADNAEIIFSASVLPSGYKFLLWLVYIVLAGAFFYMLGLKLYHPTEKLEALYEAKDILKELQHSKRK